MNFKDYSNFKELFCPKALDVKSIHKQYSLNLSLELPPFFRTIDFVKVKGKTQVLEIIQLLEFEPTTENLKLFAPGHQAYLHRKWPEAIQLFEQSNQLFQAATGQSDLPSQLYIQRCKDLIKSPPSVEWVGVWEMQEK